MKLKDAAGWAKMLEANKPTEDDPGYGMAILTFAERWADLMELAMGQAELDDEAFAQTAETTSHAADTEGITGAMYGMAVATLFGVWEHGERLNRWHNAAYGVPDATGTVNPAIVVVGAREQ